VGELEKIGKREKREKETAMSNFAGTVKDPFCGII
jgi:hypothetical protein